MIRIILCSCLCLATMSADIYCQEIFRKILELRDMAIHTGKNYKKCPSLFGNDNNNLINKAESRNTTAKVRLIYEIELAEKIGCNAKILDMVMRDTYSREYKCDKIK